jgi:hypothetical protein
MNRKIGSARWGVTAMIIMRDRSCCLIAKAMTVESKKPKDILHLWTIGEKGLSWSCASFEKSLGSARNRLLGGAANIGEHNSASCDIARSAVKVISERQEVSKYFIRNKLTRDDNNCCCTASRAGSSTFLG